MDTFKHERGKLHNCFEGTIVAIIFSIAKNCTNSSGYFNFLGQDFDRIANFIRLSDCKQNKQKKRVLSAIMHVSSHLGSTHICRLDLIQQEFLNYFSYKNHSSTLERVSFFFAFGIYLLFRTHL